tara:strand:+ start:325 stop:783 length:459 start_codon:yes stop_codon:yes gene_type:complete
MLKLIVSLSFIVLVSCSSQILSQGNVVFNNELLPSCYVDIEESYWAWRDKKGVSSNAGEDLKGLLLHVGIFNSEKHRLGYEDLEIVLCDRSFLLSSRLAKVMNFYGRNVHPKDLYSHSLNRISQLGVGVSLDVSGLIEILHSSLQELESRFE